MAASAQVTALIVLMWPGPENVIVEASTSITSLLVILASTLGYVSAEASIDARHASQSGDTGSDS